MRSVRILIIILGVAVAATLFYYAHRYLTIEHWPAPRTYSETNMRALKTAVTAYYLESGIIPKNLVELVEPHNKFSPLPQGFPLVDGWGNPYLYKVDNSNGQIITIQSFGRDGKVGGKGKDEDLELSWDLEKVAAKYQRHNKR